MSSSGQYGDLARWYDPLYAASGKDYLGEANALLDLVEGLGVEPSSLLDVACGTGLHLEAFAERVDDVVGLDSAAAMIAIAKERLGDDVAVRHGDMRSFDLERSFDVVTCLFSAIGHVRDADDLHNAVARMAAHVAPGGVLLVEPWLTPDDVYDTASQPGGHRSLETTRTPDAIVARTCRSHRSGDVLVLEFAWAIADDTGAHTATETFRMPLFTRERYLDAVRAAGLEASWSDLPALHADRGLLVGRRPAGDVDR